MAIEVYIREKSGTIILRDKRDDGTVILLVCQEYEPSGGGGVVVAPDKDEEYPMYAALERRAERAGLSRFRLEVDTSDLSPEPLRFTTREFIEAAGQAVDRGVERVELTTETAKEWGYQAGVEA
jgi:hypothetical protein